MSALSPMKALLADITALTPAIQASAQSQAISQQETHDIGVDAYLYFYPLVTMEITRRLATNVAPGKEFGKGPMNAFFSFPAYPPADFKDVARPNFDTLYSSAWLDLTKEPVVVSAPDTGDRYYLLPMLSNAATRPTGSAAFPIWLRRWNR